MKKTHIKLIENKEKNIFDVYVNDEKIYAYGFTREREAKAAAFDECCKAQMETSNIRVSYLSV